ITSLARAVGRVASLFCSLLDFEAVEKDAYCHKDSQDGAGHLYESIEFPVDHESVGHLFRFGWKSTGVKSVEIQDHRDDNQSRQAPGRILGEADQVTIDVVHDPV